jgi:hypothetical protein
MKGPTQIALAVMVAACLAACGEVQDKLGESDICSVHEVRMKTVVIHGTDALISFAPEYIEDIKAFPNASPELPESLQSDVRIKVYRCEECYKNYKSWSKDNRSTK